MRSACKASSRRRDLGTLRGAYLVKSGVGGALFVGYQGKGWWDGVGGGGCIVIAEFGVEGLHFIHANIVGNTQFELVHRGRCVEVDIVDEGARFEGKGHTLEDHFLVKVWGTKGCLTETIDKCPKRLTLFLPDAQEGDCSSLMWVAASEMG